MESANPAIKGVVIVDTTGHIALAIGAGTDRRVRALAGDAEWLNEARQRRLQPLLFDNANYVVLVTHFQEGDLIVISEPPGQALLDFIGSVDFAYEIIERLLSDPFEGMTVIDNKKRLRYISPVHEKFFGLRHGEANGRPVRDVIENTKLDRVIDTGRVEIGELQRMRGLERIVSRIPIKRGGEVIGAYGRVMFKGPEQIEGILRRLSTLEGEVEFYRREAAILRARTYGLEHLIGSSPAMRNLRSEIIKIAPLEIPVLIRGESGTGKELVAHSLHQLSPRRDAAMVMVNSAALPATLVESEFFGYEAGAFTGANKKGRKGKFEQASGGTIFLDEIGDMPLEVQVKLLRVLQDQMVERVGGDRPCQVDFRLVTATNWDLKQLVADGKFRLDLYYRISNLVIEVPPLRQRIGDILELADGFLNEIAARHARPVPELTSDALSFLMEQRWPGNVRQLRHEIERAFVFAEDERITADVLARYGDGLAPPKERATKVPVQMPTEPTTMKEALAQVEVEVIRQSMTRHKGIKKRVATELGISRSYLYKMLEGQNVH